MKTTTDTFPRPAEQTTQAYSGVTGVPSAGTTFLTVSRCHSLINYYLGATTMGYGTGDTQATGRYGTYIFLTMHIYLFVIYKAILHLVLVPTIPPLGTMARVITFITNIT